MASCPTCMLLMYMVTCRASPRPPTRPAASTACAHCATNQAASGQPAGREVVYVRRSRAQDSSAPWARQ